MSPSSHKHVFIVGCPRSGSTWTTFLLAQHPEVATFQHAKVFDYLVWMRKWYRNKTGYSFIVNPEAEGDERQATILATGSEVSVAMEARESLQAEGVATAVVSLPCWELFDAQDNGYKQEILGQGTVLVAVEAAVRQGWERYLGAGGGFVGMTGFGASAPAGDLFKHFGITADAVATEVKKRLA